MRLAIIDTLGLCYDGTTLEKRGLGGSESAVILISKELAKIGFEVIVFNDCESDDTKPGVYDNVTFKPLREVERDYIFDVMIASRSVAAFASSEIKARFKNFIGGLPNFDLMLANSKHRVLWMHDTFCDGDDLIEDLVLQNKISEIFTLSDWHTSYITNCNHGKRRNCDVLKNHIFMTRNGIGNMNPGWIDVREKDPNLFVFNASVTKGMIPLVKDIWPRVSQKIPQAKLTVIGGYYKFRENSSPDQQQMDWRSMVAEYGDKINFTGVIPQKEISSILRSASYMIYPAAFPETFGISTLESLAHNTPLITCRYGALEETAIDMACYKIPYPIEPNWSLPWLNKDRQVEIFTDAVIDAYNNKYLHQQKMYACNQIKDICTWDTVAIQWKQHLFKKLGAFLDVEEYRKAQQINSRVRKVFNRRFLNAEEMAEPKNPPFNHFTIVTPVYNAEKYIQRCIKSVSQQDYQSYEMIIIDDCSTDNTYNIAKECIANLPYSIRDKFVLMKNEKNMGAIFNQIPTIDTLSNTTVVMLLDGDDWLINDPTLFDKYNNIYQGDVEFTYGSCWSVVDNIPLISQEYPPEIKQSKTYRDYRFNWNMPYTHFRTFRAYVLKDYIEKNGVSIFKNKSDEWLKAGGDVSIFYAIVENIDPKNILCISDIVYNYNDANPLNDYKVNSKEQTKNANLILNNSPFKPGQFDLRPL